MEVDQTARYKCSEKNILKWGLFTKFQMLNLFFIHSIVSDVEFDIYRNVIYIHPSTILYIPHYLLQNYFLSTFQSTNPLQEKTDFEPR